MDIQKEWNALGEQYTTEINEMVEFGEKNGWEKWKGEEPEDKRDHLADAVIQELREANKKGLVEQFRNDFPPAHSPFIKYFHEKGQHIGPLYFVDKERVVFIVGTAYQNRRAYILDNNSLINLDKTIKLIGKSKQNNVFAIQKDDIILTRQGWDGEIIETFKFTKLKETGITELIPFNDGKKLLCLTSDGIFIISKESVKMIHPVPDPDDEEWDPYIDMENATLSNDNQFIVVGDQCSDHRILDQNGVEIGEIGPQSSYPHYCLFSEDDTQLITNSCHFYNGITIGVDTKEIAGIKVEAYEESDDYKIIDDGMRLYVGVTSGDHYIFGDAYGYVKAFDKEGNCIWKHFVGSTIGGLAISDDGKTLWVGSCTGMIHKLRLGKGHRDRHTIGTGDHYEEFRMILWKGEEKELWW